MSFSCALINFDSNVGWSLSPVNFTHIFNTNPVSSSRPKIARELFPNKTRISPAPSRSKSGKNHSAESRSQRPLILELYTADILLRYSMDLKPRHRESKKRLKHGNTSAYIPRIVCAYGYAFVLWIYWFKKPRMLLRRICIWSRCLCILFYGCLVASGCGFCEYLDFTTFRS